MFYSFSLIYFIFFAHHFLFPISNANQSVNNNRLIAFMKGHQETQISEYSKQKYEAHLGIVYFMKMNWQCDKIADEFEEYEQTECQKYRKYLDILYEYLYREYLGIPTVKPKFVFQREIEIEGPIIYAVNCLAKISQFYFKTNWSLFYKYKLNKLFPYGNFEPKLLNKERLNYAFELKNEAKLPINEMILQLAIDTANEWQPNENLNGIIRQNCGEKFDQYLEEMFRKAEERAKKDESEWRVDLINYDKHFIILHTKFDDQLKWIDDALFLEFFKGLATNSEKFYTMAKEYSNYFCQIKETENIYWFVDRRVLCETEKMKKYLAQKYEANLGLVYLMRENWQCEKIGEEFLEKCQKYRKYLHILYEYLFLLYAEAKNPKVSKQLPPLVKPIFIISGEYPESLFNIVKYLSNNSENFWQNEKFAPWQIKLVNEEELNFEIKEKKNWSHKNIPKGQQTDIETIWKEFEKKMKKICKNTKENAKKEKAKMEKAIQNAANNEEKEKLREEYNDKFGTFNSSPFS